MTLQFIIGPASQDHFKTMTDQIQTAFQNHPNDRFFYLVPNHVKFAAEVNTLKQLNRDHEKAYAQTKIQILSLSRLAWFLFGQDPEYQLPRLSNSGIDMLLYQILLDHQDELTVFRGEGNRPGFISQLASQIGILQVGQIGPDDLTRILETNEELNPNLRAKLTDLALVYKLFQSQTDHKYLNPADLMDIFITKLQQTDLQHMHFFISGFTQMSAQELTMLKIMLAKAQAVTVDLTLDTPAPHQVPERPNLFFQSAQLYHQIYEMARQQHVKILVDRHAGPQRVAADLQKFEKYWIASNRLSTSVSTKDQLTDPQAIQVLKADNPYGEVAQVALAIRRMVASGKYRYRDFIVMTRHLDRFQNVIQPIFQMQDIPVFEDQNHAMDNYPLVELLDALMTIDPGNQRRNYRYADMMRLLKSELLIPKLANGDYMPLRRYRDDVALLENLLLKNGYQGETVWTADHDWQYVRINSLDFNGKDKVDPEITRQINEIRHFVKQILPPFYQKLRQAKTGAQAAQILYEFLIDHGVVDQLQSWRQTATDHNELNEASQPEQVWQTFCGLLDDYVTILGEHEFKLTNFWNLLQSGFAGANYSQIPSTLDQVTVSESGIVQAHTYKVAFMIGSTDETMPDSFVNESLINDGDQEVLTTSLNDDQFLPNSSETTMANEAFLNYSAFLSASQRLIFTYSLNNVNNEETGVKISPYVERIMKHFGLTERIVHSQVPATLTDVLPYVGTKRTTLRHLVQAAYQSKQTGEDLSDTWHYVYQQLLTASDYYHDLTNQLLGGVDYHNQPHALLPQIATKLYSNVLDSSISQLEDFYKNPYEYFLTYGLRLKKRPEFELSSGNKGQFFHSILERTVTRINQLSGVDLSSIDPQRLLNIVEQVGRDMVQNDPRYQILSSSSQMSYVTHILMQTAKRMALTMHWQSRYTPMRPRQTEVSFGQTGHADNLAPLLFDLDDQHRLRVRGRIDRIDSFIAPHDNKRFLSIVDYKSGDKKIAYDQLYSGMSIQLMTYLDVIKRNLNRYSQQQKAELAGALYLHIQNPILTSKDLKSRQPQAFETAMLKAQKYNGLLVDDPDVVDAIEHGDLNDQHGRYSLLYANLSKTKNGLKGKTLISNEQLTELLEYTEHLIQNAGRKILGGNVNLLPLKTHDFDAMKYTDFAPIMQFDPLLSENNYRQIDKIDNLSQLLNQIKKGDHSDGLH